MSGVDAAGAADAGGASGAARSIGPISVSPIGFGCMEIGGRYGDVTREDALTLLRTALDEGVTLFDTSDRYGAGQSERLLGEAIRGSRERVVVCTKFGHVLGPDGEVVRDDGSPDYVRQACDASLARLGVDRIDLYLQHRVDPTVPIEETVGAMGELVTAGKVGAIGLCEVRPATLRRAVAQHPIAVVQSEYSLWYRGVEAELLPACRDVGAAFMAYAPLGRGLLADAASIEFAPGDRRRAHPRFHGENLARNLAIVNRVRRVAEELGVRLPQLCLAWLLAKGRDVVPIPGTTSVQHLRDDLAAADIELTPELVTLLDDLVPVGAGAGERYPAAAMASVDQ